MLYHIHLIALLAQYSSTPAEFTRYLDQTGETTLCLKKTSPTFLAITRESIDGFL